MIPFLKYINNKQKNVVKIFLTYLVPRINCTRQIHLSLLIFQQKLLENKSMDPLQLVDNTAPRPL